MSFANYVKEMKLDLNANLAKELTHDLEPSAQQHQHQQSGTCLQVPRSETQMVEKIVEAPHVQQVEKIIGTCLVNGVFNTPGSYIYIYIYIY